MTPAVRHYTQMFRRDNPTQPKMMTKTPAEMEAQSALDYSRLTGKQREDAAKYLTLVISGAYGPISQAGADYARRMLKAMSW